MHIVYMLTRSDVFGGATVHVRDLAKAVMCAGGQATIMVGGKGPVVPSLRKHGLEVRPLPALTRNPAPSDLKAIAAARRELRSLRPDLVSTHTTKAGLVGRVAARLAGVPAMHTAHGWQFGPGLPRRQAIATAFLERRLAPITRRIVTVSEADRQLAIRHRIGRPDHVTTVHNGVHDVDTSLRANVGILEPNLVMVGRFEPQKDQALLITALCTLDDLPWHLTFVGSGPTRARVEAQVAASGLTSRVTFAGEVSDPAPILARSQVFILASNWEGLPRSILEAMRSGLPVVASDVGGVREQVIDGVTGLVVPRGSREALADALRTIITNAELRERLGAAARASYERKFTFELMLSRTLGIYRDIMQPR